MYHLVMVLMFTSCYIKSRNFSLFLTKKFSFFFVTNSENVSYLEKIETKKCVGNSFKTACLIVDSIFHTVFFKILMKACFLAL